MKIYFKILLIFLIFSVSLFSDDKPSVGLDEKLGNQLPLELVFTDEYGKPVQLKSLIDKPSILVLVYYRCPGICSPLLSGVSLMTERLDLTAGKDYNIITVSFNPKEDYITASGKKLNYFDNMQKKINPDAWRFLTGDSASIAALTDAVGFRYEKQGDDYIHSAFITVVSPSGKIARYLYGVEFLPLDVKLALAEASEGKTGPTIAKIVRLCYSYDPEGRRYVLNITRIAGGGILLVLLGFVFILTLKRKRKKPYSDSFNKNSLNGKGNQK
ncbi:MAG: SCO family protein [Ignavibacteria bacterium]|nr:SCO family protein [Ignavibacteria bacterium]